MQVEGRAPVSVWWFVFLGLSGVALVQGALLRDSRTVRATSQPAVSPPIGAVPDLVVHRAGASKRQKLSEFGAGSCRLIVVYSPTCGASLNAARRWHQDLSSGAAEGAVPAGWSNAWLSVEDSVASAGFLPEGFSQPQLYSSSPGAALGRLGIGAVPAYLILDREGVVLSGGLGAPLHQTGSYATDCTIQALRDPANES